MNVAVIYNEPKHTEAGEHWLSRAQSSDNTAAFVDASEFGVVEQMQSIAKALTNTCHTVTTFSVNDNAERLCKYLATTKPDIIFNCCESILGDSKQEMNVAAIYELFDIPYTGASAMSLGLALNKALAKAIFTANGISTPKYAVLHTVDISPAKPLRYPRITKPVAEDASIGIDADAVVHNDRAFRKRVTFLLNEFKQPVLAEEYIDGRELNIALLADANQRLQPLPISEITFNDIPSELPKIVSYEAKWVEESPLYQSTKPVCPATLDRAVAKKACDLAIRAANALGLRDYARVDMRMDSNNDLYVLEANPNPDISEDAGFMRAARASGRSYDATIIEILERAIERSK